MKRLKLQYPQVGEWNDANKYVPYAETPVVVSFLDGDKLAQGLQLGRFKKDKWFDYNGELMLFKPLYWQVINVNLDK